jgi:hypothetical protein
MTNGKRREKQIGWLRDERGGRKENAYGNW